MKATLIIRTVHVSPGGYELGLPDRETAEIFIGNITPLRGDVYHHGDRRLTVEGREWAADGLVLRCVERVPHVPVKTEAA